jgi:hypothetical protein
MVGRMKQPHTFMARAGIAIVLLATWFCTAGCAVPIVTLSTFPDDECFITKVTFEALKDNRASREIALERIGNPRYRASDDSYFGYIRGTSRIRPTLVLMVFPLVLPSAQRTFGL